MEKRQGVWERARAWVAKEERVCAEDEDAKGHEDVQRNGQQSERKEITVCTVHEQKKRYGNVHWRGWRK